VPPTYFSVACFSWRGYRCHCNGAGRCGERPRNTGALVLAILKKSLTLQYARTYCSLMSKPSLREDILNAGLKMMFRSGYQGASVRDICAAAGAPHGSFTNHFRSKEAFAQEVVDRYFANTKEFVKAALDDKSLTPRQRLKRYLDIIGGVLEAAKWNRGCLIGDFSVETTSQSKLLRHRLEAIFQEWRAPFASCIAEAQTAGEIDSTFDPMDLVEFLLASWEGAILRMKVERGPAALDRFKNIAFQTVFKEQK
jgi:TetR/AcrR family transcriptional repressor of nem operon